MLELHKRFWPAVLVVATLVAVQSIFVTHRVVGPAYHVQRILEGFAAGKYEMRAHLRRYWKWPSMPRATPWSSGKRRSERARGAYGLRWPN
ncbi:MAG: hypothetical protein HY766_02530 [candidate division NC10 bacterium]|nr:hypothetical protein [candidate division NC10 bacterium]